MFGKKDIDIMALRKDAELSGLLNTKKGITIFYTTYLGLDIDIAEPKIRKECLCRDIPFEAPTISNEKPKNFWENTDGAFGSINNIVEKYPIVKTTVMPMISQILAGGVTALLGVVTGKKIQENNEENQEQSLEDLEISDTPLEPKIEEDENL